MGTSRPRGPWPRPPWIVANPRVEQPPGGTVLTAVHEFRRPDDPVCAVHPLCHSHFVGLMGARVHRASALSSVSPAACCVAVEARASTCPHWDPDTTTQTNLTSRLQTESFRSVPRVVENTAEEEHHNEHIIGFQVLLLHRSVMQTFWILIRI